MILSLTRRRVKSLGALSAGFTLALGLVCANAALAEPRVALIIGNSAYSGDMPALTNPANDARLMEGALKSVGFDVVAVMDATKDEMTEAIGLFRDKLLAAGSKPTGLVFYAGHGLQVAGENYLIPVDAKIKAEKDVMLASISADMVMKQMEFAEPAVKIVILDACRNNPLGDGARSMSRGLAKIETATTGTFLAYSTAPGSTAADGDGVNSPYTKALAETITQPGLSIADVFQEVRTKVLASTGNEQTPWDSSSLTGRFYFKEPDPSQTVAATPAEEALKTEKIYWDSVKDSGDPDAIQLYLNKYPNGYFVDLANAELEELNKGTQVASAEQPSDARTGEPAQPSGQTVAKPSVPAPASTDVGFIAQSQTVYAKGGGQVRQAPDAKSSMVNKLQTNTEVTATGISTDGKWWRVQTADGQTGYMHSTVVAEQPIQTAAAPAQPALVAQEEPLEPDALEMVSAQSAPPPPPSNDAAAQLFQGLAQGAAQQLGLPVNIPQVQTQPAQQQAASSLTFNPINESIKVREGAKILNAVGGQPIFNVTKATPLLAIARSSDGRWYQVSLPTGGQGYVPRQSVVK